VTETLSSTDTGPRIPLRITLVALLVALVAVALAATGVTATSLLKQYLQDQSDTELRATVKAFVRTPGLLEACIAEPNYAQPSSTYVACLAPDDDDPIVLATPRGPGNEMPEVDAAAVEKLRRGVGPFSVDSSGRGDWRMASEELPEGYTLVIADEQRGNANAIGRLVRIEVVVGLIVLTVLGAAGYLLVRNSLRPLVEVERTARAIAAGDLSQRVPAGDDRTEVGRLTTALNWMLSRIEDSFRSQQASEEEARASEERIRRFVADASHELRTPLTSIRGFAELYRQGAVRTEEDIRRLLQRIEAEGGRMGLLVEDLLLLARLDQERPLTIAPVDLAAIAGDAVHDARAVQPDRPLALHLDESLTDVPVVLGDESRLRQVVGNLLTNALVHTPGDVRVTVSVAADPEDADMVVLQVADQGPGMDPEDAGRAFERFYRADASRTRAAGGTGLGLAIVASLVAAHGGTVRLDTAPGQGARVTVRLPRSGPPEPAVGGPGEGPA
jgi:signal transduction histidine kinase